MTAYTSIANSRVDPESPVDTNLITQLRDNPIAMFEGSAGAPTLAIDAIGFTLPGKLLDSKTPSAASAVDFTTGFDTTYNFYIISLVNFVCNTNATNLRLFLSEDGGSSVLTGNYYYIDSATPATTFTIATACSNDSTVGVNGYIVLGNMTGTSTCPIIQSKIIFKDSSSVYGGEEHGGVYNDGGGTAANAVQLKPVAGTVTGTARLYGFLGAS